MKKFRIPALLLALAMVFSLCACGGATYDESLMGVYTCYAIEVMGYQLAAEDVLTEPATLELKQGGKGKIGIEGESGSIRYTLEGEAITVEIEGETAAGTLKDGVIDIEIIGMHMFFIQEGGDIPTGDTTPTAGEEAGADSILPMSFDFSECHIEIVGIEPYTDYNEETAVRFYMDYTNTGDNLFAFYNVINCDAFQDGSQLVSAYPDPDLPEYNTGSQKILPGCTVRVVEEYVFQPDGGEVELKLYEYSPDDAAVVTVEPGDLPGAPSEPFTYTPCDSSSLVAGLSASGILGDVYDVTIRDLELTRSWYGADMARVFIDFTNNAAEATQLWDVTVVTAMQDGITLSSSYAEDDVQTDDNYTVSVEPGQSITVSMCYVIHDTGSPIAFLIDGFAVTGEVGTMLELP